jgi:hypothetical protein
MQAAHCPAGAIDGPGGMDLVRADQHELTRTHPMMDAVDFDLHCAASHEDSRHDLVRMRDELMIVTSMEHHEIRCPTHAPALPRADAGHRKRRLASPHRLPAIARTKSLRWKPIGSGGRERLVRNCKMPCKNVQDPARGTCEHFARAMARDRSKRSGGWARHGGADTLGGLD